MLRLKSTSSSGEDVALWQAGCPYRPPMLVGRHLLVSLLHLKSTSSSGQDVALWPRQPRFKSWCGHFGGMAMLPLPCQLLRAACPLALGPCPPRVHRAWHSGVVPRRRQHRQAMGQRMAGADCARQAPPYRSTMPAGNCLLRSCCASSPHLLVVRTPRCGKQAASTGHPCQ